MSRKANKNYTELRKGLLDRGFNLRSWALAHGLPVSTVYGAARGERAGVKAVRIRKQLEELAA